MHQTKQHVTQLEHMGPLLQGEKYPDVSRQPQKGLTSVSPWTTLSKEENFMSFQDRIQQRQSLRRCSLDTVHFRFANDSPDEIHLGATVNISNMGMCLFTSDHLKEGENLVIQTDVLTLKASVRWVKNFGQNIYKAGLMFVK